MKCIVMCDLCDGEAFLYTGLKERSFRNEIFQVTAHYYKCNNCKEEFTTNEIDDIDTLQVYNQYREKYKILFPQQITELKNKYDLSSSKLSGILGFGINVIKNYEKGEVPNQSNATLLNLIRDPKEMRKIVEDKKDLIGVSEYHDLILKLDTLIMQEQVFNWENCIPNWDKKTIPNQYTGFNVPSFDKFANMVIYLLVVTKFKVHLNKLLFYSDFMNYNLYGKSISGCMYQAIQMGPVPYRYDLNFDLMQNKNYIDTGLTEINGSLVEEFIKVKEFDESLFNEKELYTLNYIYENLGKLSTDELVKMSHNEIGWLKENTAKNLISYQKYAFDIKMKV